MGRIIPDIMENKKCLKPPIRLSMYGEFACLLTPRLGAKNRGARWHVASGRGHAGRGSVWPLRNALRRQVRMEGLPRGCLEKIFT